ncbi:MAG: PIN domain protein [Planctomycetota bacterium]|nr:PIN domain protein [Planctomycetota bacterium]
MIAQILRIYLENSAIGGYFDDEFAVSTRRLFAGFRAGRYQAVISAHVIAELEQGAPAKVKENLQTIDYEEYPVNDEMLALAEKYLAEGIVTSKYYSDALHIAAATVLNIDVLVSWNFKHIVNFDKIRLFNAVNLREHYRPLEIRTPQEVTGNEET